MSSSSDFSLCIASAAVKSSLVLPRPFRTGLVIVAVLAATGWAMQPLDGPIRQELLKDEPELRLDSLADVLGQGVTVGLLGGFRTLVADFLFLKAAMDWEDERLPATIAGLKLATIVDPRSLYFWLNGGSMIALDMSNWRINEAGGFTKVPKARQAQIDREQAALGLAFLEDARRFHPHAWSLYFKMGFIRQMLAQRIKGTDPAGAREELLRAAELYRVASEQPHAPYFLARVHAIFLGEAGRPEEAYAAWVKLYPTLPKAPDDLGYARMPKKTPPPSEDEIAAAAASNVLGHIRELEKQLGIPPEKAFQP